MTNWGSWKESHPETLVMVNDYEKTGWRIQEFSEDFAIGLILAGQARAYYFTDIRSVGVINDCLGDIPVLLWASGDMYQTYVRQAADQMLTFKLEGDRLVDEETGTRWDPQHGLETDGPLAGEALLAVPSLSSYDWAWVDFYPEAGFYSP